MAFGSIRWANHDDGVQEHDSKCFGVEKRRRRRATRRQAAQEIRRFCNGNFDAHVKVLVPLNDWAVS